MAQTEDLPYPHQTIDLDPNVKDAWGLPAPRLTYDFRRPNELARIEFMMKKMEEIGRGMGACAGVARAAALRALRAPITRAAPAWAATRRPRW